MERPEREHTKDIVSIFGTTICPSGRNSCPGYGDLESRRYCCPSPLQSDGYYCCDYWEKYRSNGRLQWSIVEITAGVVGGLLIFALVLMCLFCRRCCLYKWRHRNREKGDSNNGSIGSIPRRRWTRAQRWPQSNSYITLDVQNGTVHRKSMAPNWQGNALRRPCLCHANRFSPQCHFYGYEYGSSGARLNSIGPRCKASASYALNKLSWTWNGEERQFSAKHLKLHSGRSNNTHGVTEENGKMMSARGDSFIYQTPPSYAIAQYHDKFQRQPYPKPAPVARSFSQVIC